MDLNNEYEEMARKLFEAGEFVPLVCGNGEACLELRALPGRHGISLCRVSPDGPKVNILAMTEEEARRFAAILRGCADGLRAEET